MQYEGQLPIRLEIEPLEGIISIYASLVVSVCVSAKGLLCLVLGFVSVCPLLSAPVGVKTGVKMLFRIIN
jgi:hypothetical protein